MTHESRLLRVITWVISGLGADYPVRLSLGMIIGFTLLAFRDGIIGAGASPESWMWRFVEGIHWWGYITLGLVVVFLPLVFKSRPAEYYEKMFRTLDEVAKRGGFTDDQKQKLYSSFAERILIAFDPTLSIAEQRSVMKERLEDLSRDIGIEKSRLPSTNIDA